MENMRIFLSEKLPFLVVKFSVYLNRRVLTSAHNLCFEQKYGKYENFFI